MDLKKVDIMEKESIKHHEKAKELLKKIEKHQSHDAPSKHEKKKHAAKEEHEHKNHDSKAISEEEDTTESTSEEHEEPEHKSHSQKSKKHEKKHESAIVHKAPIEDAPPKELKKKEKVDVKKEIKK